MTIDLSRENKNIVYKHEVPKKHKSLLKDIIAFANTTGGKVIIGIEDKTHSVYGIDPSKVEELSDNITNMIYDNCSPILYTNITTTALDDKNVLVIDVAAGKNRPYYLTSEGKEKSSYVRINGTSRPADATKLKELEMENYHISFDKLQYIGEPYSENEALQLCHDLKEFSLENAKTKEERERVKDLTILKLVDMGLLGKIGDDYYPTNAYNLMTKNSFDQAIIQCALFKGLTRGVFIDRKVFSGPIYKQIDAAYQFVLRNINYSFEIDGIRRRDNYEISQESIRESIINAVCTDYI